MTTALRTRVSDMLGIEYPIFAFAHHEDVIVEAANGGAIGVYGGTRKTPREIRDVLKTIRKRLGDRPFGLDLVIPKGMPASNNREEIEAQLPAEHRVFIDHLYEKYNIGRPLRAGTRR